LTHLQVNPGCTCAGRILGRLPDEKEGKMSTTATNEGRLGIEGYDQLGVDDLDQHLRHRSQVELAEIDKYEHAHQDRRAVLQKLRHLRSTEPLEGYDELEPAEILDALKDADIAKLRGVRGYEAKLRQRDEVLEGVTRLREARTAEGTATRKADAESSRSPYAAARGLKAGASNFGMIAIVILASLVFAVALFMGGYVILTVVAPDLVS
jgi:hypothetical protein